jgi:hypothetical protein
MLDQEQEYIGKTTREELPLNPFAFFDFIFSQENNR